MNDSPAMRILILTNLFPPAVRGGYELECATMVDHLRESHDVQVLTSREGRNGASEPGVLRLLPFLPHRPSSRLLSPFNAVRGAIVARGVLRRFRPDAIWIYNGTMIPQSSLRVLQEAGVPTLFRVSEHWFADLYDVDAFMAGLRGGRWSRLMKLTDRLPPLRLRPRGAYPAAISWCSEALRRGTPVPDTVEPVFENVVLPATTQGERFATLARNPAPEPTIALIGRLAPHKGTDVAILALAALQRRGVDARLVLAGDGEPTYLAELDRLARELGIADMVDTRGPLDSDGVADLLSSAWALAAPSVWEEPGGLVVAEGALARVPVVASRVGGIPEYLGDEQALLVGPGDPEALAAALEEALAGGPAVEARVAAAFERAQGFRAAAFVATLDRFLAAGIEAQRRG